MSKNEKTSTVKTKKKDFGWLYGLNLNIANEKNHEKKLKKNQKAKDSYRCYLK